MSVKKFTVIESKWLRGGHNAAGEKKASRLENPQGEKCCMGFLAEACGVPEEIRRAAYYFSCADVAEYDAQLPETLRPREVGLDARAHGALAQAIYEINDSLTTDDESRKKALIEAFADAGIEVEFVP